MRTSVYVLVGYSGSHSDREEWLVAVYGDLERAKEHRELATAEARKARELCDREYLSSDDYALPKSYDTQRVMYYDNGYAVVEVPLVAHVDQYLEFVSKVC